MNNPSLAANDAALSISQRPPVVLTRDLADRLQKVNAVTRMLRTQECRVVGQDLRLGTRRRPLLHIRAAQLPAGCTGRINRREQGASVTCAHWRGVELLLVPPTRQAQTYTGAAA